MSRTPLHSRKLTEGSDRTPHGSRVLKDKTPRENRLPDESIDQRLLDVLRSLNLAVAAVAQARDRRFADPNAKLSPEMAVQAMVHIKDAAQQLDILRHVLA